MSISGKVLIALLVALGSAAVAHYVFALGSLLPLFALSATASLLSVLLSHNPLPGTQLASDAPAPQRQPEAPAPAKKKPSQGKGRRRDTGKERGSGREDGVVKWFNTSKGFGFIVRDNGEEIFVHHNSIRGDGRRGLRDGAAVSFRVAETAKGPQAEDVETRD